ncbi:LysR family transcriptional regulator [Neoroseomonas lacus]|uniref:LysR family transcriptional regulator n=1 Tax=Neoroseomonas lacus TaxID=287609 RepID=A0A917KFY8_9PROT|nr:LysR family transcriptional regulator [Neoroseomonas lacus]
MSCNVTLRQLRAFLTVARERSFTRAAAQLHVTQSALTVSIKSLEAELGLKLLDRSTRSVTPTLHGERFLTLAERMLEEMEQALDDLQAHARRERGLVVVAATASLVSHALAPALGVLNRRHPGILVRILEANTGEATRRLLSGEADIILTTLLEPDPAMDAVPLLRDRFGVACAPGHKLLAGAGPLDWSALRDQPLLSLGSESGIRALLERQAPSWLAHPRARHEVSSVGGLRSLIRQGIGVAALPALAALPMREDGLGFRPLAPAVYRTVYLARRQGRSPTPATSALVALLLDQVALLADETIEALAVPEELRRMGFG